MVVFVTFKNKENTIKNEEARVVTTLYINFSGAQGQLTPYSVMASTSRNSNLSRLLWLSSLPARNEDKPIKDEGARVLTILYIDFSDAQGQLTQ